MRNFRGPVKNRPMSLPIVAIVGRPNVGKSSLLNCLAGRRIAIVESTPGVTRDRISSPLELEGEDQPADQDLDVQDDTAGGAGYVELVDTGGMGIEDVDDLTDHVEAQIRYAVDAAALIIFVVDAREGLTPLDRKVAEMLRRRNKPSLLVANKIDQVDQISEVHELHGLGFGEPLCVSAIHNIGRGELLKAIRRHVREIIGDAPPEAVMKLAIVGKRNAGKSTFINTLAGQDRVIVSETPGTTRDSVDVHVELDGRTFVVIDTAGVRKKRKISGDIEFYSHHRALRSIRRADVVALMIDASLKISQVDKVLAATISEHHKPVVLVVNKWDLAEGRARGEDYAEYLTKMLPEVSFAPISLTTATTGLNVGHTVHLAEQLFDQASTRVSTGQLNAVVEEILAVRGPSHKSGTRPPKLYYATQIGTAPPTIVCFVNDLRSFENNYRRFLVNQFRLKLPFAEVPIRLLLRRHRSERQ